MRKTVVSGLALTMIFMGTSSVYAEVSDKDCGDFTSQQEVMEFWYVNGYSAEYDPHRLDGDGDGLACEVSQSEYQNFVTSKSADSTVEGNESVKEEAEGEKMPDTASSSPLMILLGASAAAAGSLLLFRRKRQAF